MSRIKDFELGIALKAAADRCLADETSEFMSLEINDTEVDPRVEKQVMSKLQLSRWKGVQKVIKVASIALISAFAVAMCIQPVRAAVFGAVITWYEDHISVRYEDNTYKAVGENMSVPAKFGYLPQGWSVTFEKISRDSYSCYMENAENGVVYFSQFKDCESRININKNVISEELIFLMGGTVEANLFVYDSNKYILVWNDGYVFTVLAENIELNELIKIAEGLE